MSNNKKKIPIYGAVGGKLCCRSDVVTRIKSLKIAIWSAVDETVVLNVKILEENIEIKYEIYYYESRTLCLALTNKQREEILLKRIFSQNSEYRSEYEIYLFKIILWVFLTTFVMSFS